MITAAHKDFVDYYRLLKTNYVKGTRIFKSIMNQPALANAFINNFGALQVIYTGIDPYGGALDPNAYDLINILNASGYADQAFLNYLTFCGISHGTTVLATVQSSTYMNAIIADEAALTCLLSTDSAGTDCVTNSTAWNIVLNSSTIMKAMKASYSFMKAICDNVSTGVASINAIRNNATAKAAFNTNRVVLTGNYSVPANIGAGLFMIIHAGGAGGNGGYRTEYNCGSYYNYTATAGSAGYGPGSAGRAYSGTSYTSTGGGGGRGSFGWGVLRLTPLSTISITAANNAITSVAGIGAPSLSSSDQTKTIVTIGTDNANTSYGSSGYGYGDLGSVTGATGTGGLPGGQGYGSGGGGGGSRTGSPPYAGGLGATGCAVLYRR